MKSLIRSATLAALAGAGSLTVASLAQAQTQNTAAGDGIVEEVTVFATLDEKLSVGSKSGGTLRETPKSITILTNERIEAQNLTSLQEALVQTTGVTVGAFSPLDTFYYSRGIRLETLQFDGGAPAYTGGLGFFYTPDTATIERVEMLRGVDGMYSGAGEPGGVINLVRKRAQRTSSMNVNVSGGSWDNYRGILDVTGPLALDGRLRGRAVASYMDRGYHIDRYTTEKQILFGTLEMDVTDSTLVAIGANYEKREDDAYPGWSGVPRFSNGQRIPVSREFNPAPDWSRWHLDTMEMFGRVEQQYGETGTIKLNVTQIEQDSDLKQSLVYGRVDPVTLGGSRIYGTMATYSAIQRMADLSASGKVELFGRTHNYTVGADYTQLDGGQHGYSLPTFAYGNNVGINYFNFNPALYPEPNGTFINYYPKREQSQRGVYATVGIQLAEPLRLTLGGRHANFRYDEALRAVATGATTYLRYDDSKFIPSAALSYNLTDRWTTYLSYGETYKSQGNLYLGPTPGSSPLDPIVGENMELGIKGDVFDGVTAAASIYRLIRDGQGVVEPGTIAAITDPSAGTRCCYIQQGKITVEGMDIEMSGAILPGWQLFGGYTFSQTDYVGNPTGAVNLGRTPKHQGKVWSSYRLPGRLSDVTLNTGVISQSSATYGTFNYGGITLWNASVQYALNETWTLGLYGDNLTDKVYWQPTGTLDNQNVYGTPRSLTFTVRGRW
ncbi:TonB-dependent siderophore receptor [Steroidobacter sp.]|uniref:TonB-dependent siderophore receptor n=1 Tax=Steroidobacter sp. TaxID=1978227 RepID=UPI001A5D2AF9|nr:TonB-dependent siderophore receptor [Steroidobacter sp.]MBL8267493.1 TonB-dependent siderophore receptor [Steroidobacter sp.]